jgi:4-amino-4-deoxy-L-arabinose transferase-like glycosyltransferase
LQIRWTIRRSVTVLTLLALLACVLCISTYRIFGNFWDEPEHIAAGLALIDRGEYLYDTQHPPLARLAAAIGPYLAGVRLPPDPDPSGEAQGRQLLYHSAASYEQLLTLARLGMLPFLLVLLGSTWLWMRRWYGDAAAVLALLFLISSPVILGHAAVVALDVPVTGLIMASLYLLLRWFQAPGVARGLGLGLATGLAVATKMSAVPFIGIAALALVLSRLALARMPATPAPLHARTRRRAISGALALGVALLIMIGVYGPNLAFLTTPELAPNRALNFIAGSRGPWHELVYRFAAHVPLPLGVEMVPVNFLDVEWHNAHGHLSFLLGQVAKQGWWYFYLVALTFKTTVPLLLLGLSGLVLLAIRGAREANLYLLAPGACFASILAFCCLYSHINIGVRHVLIAYPLLAMGAGYAVVTLWRLWPARGARAVLLGLVLWQASTLAYAYPDYLAYFNLLAGDHPERILVDSDLDWGGQDLRRLERVLAARHVTQLSLGYRGTADLSLEALPAYSALKPNQPVTGWVAISMLTLQENQAGYRWLAQYQPVQRVGGSFYLYDIP